MAQGSHRRAGLIFIGVCVLLGGGIFVLEQGKDALRQLATPVAAASPTATSSALPSTEDNDTHFAHYEPQGSEASTDSSVTEPLRVAPSQVDDAGRRGSSLQLVKTYFSVGSQGEDEALAWLSAHYADTVDYFGSRKGRAAVLKDKLAYIRRWPTRNYSMEPDSVLVTCGDAQPLCHTRGIVDWSASSPERGAESQGKASFDLVTYESSQGLVIVGETSKVISR